MSDVAGIVAALPSADGGERIEVAPGPLPEGLRQRARQALATGEPLRLTIRATGPMRDWLRVDRTATESMAARAPGKPVLGREHEGVGGLFSAATHPPEEGVIEVARVVANDVMEQDIALSGRPALEALAMGINPGWSFHGLPLRASGTSRQLCSCGAEWNPGHAWGTGHFPGERTREGEAITVTMAGEWDYAETTRTYLPRGEGTQVVSYAAATDWIGDIERERADWRARKAGTMSKKAAMPDPMDNESHDDFMQRCMGDGNDESSCATRWSEMHPQESAKMPDTKAQTESPEAARIRAMEAKLAEMEAERSVEKAQLATLQANYERQQDAAITEAIVAAARAGKLHQLANTPDAADPKSGMNQERALARAMGLEAYKAHLERIPSNPALAAGVKTPAPGVAPGEIGIEGDHQALADRMRDLAKANPKASADEITRLAYASLTAEGRPVTLH